MPTTVATAAAKAVGTAVVFSTACTALPAIETVAALNKTVQKNRVALRCCALTIRSLFSPGLVGVPLLQVGLLVSDCHRYQRQVESPGAQQYPARAKVNVELNIGRGSLIGSRCRLTHYRD